jgi:hypothetical protein
MGRVSHQRTMDSIRLFGKYVIPHFKANGQAASANGQC